MNQKPGIACMLAPLWPRLLAFLLMMIAGGNATAAVGAGPDAYGYTSVSIPIVYEDLSITAYGATEIFSTADDAGVTVPIGFPFVFYGVTYTSVSITSNGTLTFQGIDTDWVPVNITTTAPHLNKPMIAPFWHDWTFMYFGSDAVYYVTAGAVGSRRFMVHWSFAQDATETGDDTVNFEVKLFEGSNNIEFHYDDATVSDNNKVSNGRDATVGIRDINGQTNNRNLMWSFDQSVLNDDTALRIVAPKFKITSIARLANKHVRLTCIGAPSIVNKVQASSNLSAASWVNLTPAAPAADSAGNFVYDDAGAVPLTRRFYRLAYP